MVQKTTDLLLKKGIRLVVFQPTQIRIVQVWDQPSVHQTSDFDQQSEGGSEVIATVINALGVINAEEEGSLKTIYGQPLHYFTNIHLKLLDKAMLEAEDELVPLDTIIHPVKDEMSTWMIEEVHSLTILPHQLHRLCSLKTIYGQPLHYITNIHLKLLDKAMLGVEDELVPLDTIIHPVKAEMSIWIIEEVHRLTTLPLELHRLWLDYPMYLANIEALIYPKRGA
ncbi:hypothetical protein RD792_006006 [Penstemon davidsonii]|uniref:Uncharacterized protein n=1 Tax=Penstemon davidsonii TaxID=160366 RepID=A0ABR0DWT2_9LAMI|nr:hypothetical protein RD792_006006 [Penstemon davidsonii]